jgi:hypothetical protein
MVMSACLKISAVTGGGWLASRSKKRYSLLERKSRWLILYFPGTVD